MWEDLPLFMGDEGALEETLVEGSLRHSIQIYLRKLKRSLWCLKHVLYIFQRCYIHIWYFKCLVFFSVFNATMAVNEISICVQIIKHESPLCAICMLPKCMFYFLLIEDLSQRPSWLFLHIANLCFIYLYMLFYTYFM